ncbi:non-ribosomal peptide synthetase [Xenorhabdus littoralis]|nr:non-ribosomal peptide synthetase [Xenorhabdus sp. Reich]
MSHNYNHSSEIPLVINNNGSLSIHSYPLSSPQQAIWFDQIFRSDASYNVGLLVCIEGELDENVFTRAFEAIVYRHDVLRLQLLNIQALPVQKIADTLKESIVIRDFSSQSDTKIDVTLTIATEFMRPFQMAGKLWRSKLLCVNQTYRYWQFCCHHLIMDGMGLFLLLEEVINAYNHLLKENPLSPQKAPSYLDFIKDDRAYINSQRYSCDLQFWLKRYENLPPPLLHPISASQSVINKPSKPVLWSIDPVIFKRIEQAINGQKLSLLHFIYTLLACYFFRTTGIDEIVIGIPVHNRKNIQQKHTVGLFASVIPIGVTISSEDTFRDVMNKATSEIKLCYKHQHFPISELNRQTHIRQKTGRNQLFDITLSFEPFNANLHLEGETTRTKLLDLYSCTPYPFSVRIKQYTDTSSPENNDSPITIELGFSTDYFSFEEVSALQSRLAVLLDAALNNMDAPIADLPILPGAERHKILMDFNATQAHFPQDALIHQLVEAQVRQTPDAIAVCFGGQSLSYEILNCRANQLAHHLIALGVKPGDRVAICVTRSLNIVIGFLGILKAGGVYVPLDPTYPTERLRYMLEDAEPTVFLTQTTLTDPLTTTIPTVNLDNPASFSTLSSKNPEVKALGLTSRHLAYIIYTSGSTGQPKGVMIEHRSLCNLLVTQQNALTLSPNSRVLQFASYSFDACIWECCMALLAGARLYLATHDHLLPGAALSRFLADNAITHALLSPTVLAAMDTLPDTLQTLIVGGEACPSTLVKRWSQGRQLINAYGPTEITVCATLYQCRYQTETAPPIGYPIANTRIYLLDACGQPVPIGVIGEIYIGGVGVARGYLNHPELTAGRFLTDPFSPHSDARMYKTGDLGRWLPDGKIEYLGRNDFQVKIRGFRVELEEIEARLVQCHGVREAVVLLRKNEKSQPRLVAYLLPQAGIELVPGELHQQLAQHLADYMLPRAFVVLDTFPLTPNGKLDRQALPEPDQTAIVTRSYEIPVGDAEITLAQIWKGLLSVDNMSRHDNFFELGGHSLIAVDLIKQLDSLNWRLDIHTVLSTPVLNEMAQAMQRYSAQENSGDVIVPPNLIPDCCTAITPDMLTLVSLSQHEIEAIAAQIPGGAANIQDIYPLAPLQEGILFHHRLQSQGDTYLLRSILAFDNRKRLNAFLTALQQLIDRHDILRTAIYWKELAQPVQSVWRHASLAISTFVPNEEQDIPSQLLAHTDPNQRRLNLSQAPLFSADITYDPHQEEWLLALCFHHLVCDHMTLELIIAEISEQLHGQTESSYIRHQRDEKKHLPILPYRNFVAQSLQIPASAHEIFFREMLADVDEPTVPFGMLDVHSGTQQIIEATQSIDTPLTREIHLQARRQGVSPSILFHVALGLVLAKISGRDDVVFGTVLLGRMQGRAGIEQTMGLFINTLPIRLRLAGNNVQAAIQATYLSLMQLLEHEQAPLTLAQHCSGIIPPLPLFNTLLNYRHSQSEAPFAGWEGIRQLTVDARSNYPLTLSVDDLSDKFRLIAMTVSGIDPTRLLAYITTALTGLVEALATQPQRPVLSLPILPANERQQLLVDFNATQTYFPQEALIHRLFEAQVQRTPDAIAVVFQNQSMSYHELNQRANCLAHHLITLGIQPDDRVVLCIERSMEMMVGILGILKAGGAYVPLDPTYPAERLANIFNDAKPKVLLTQAYLKEKLNCIVPTLMLDDVTYPDLPPEPVPDIQIPNLNSHHLAYIIYTSGSTGQPKGVMAEHGNVCNYLLWALEYGLTDKQQDGIVSSPLAFDATVTSLYLPLLCGGKLQLLRDGEELSELLPTLLSMTSGALVKITPSYFSVIGQKLKEMGQKCPAHCFVVAGEILPKDTVSLWRELSPDSRIINEYGPTETTVGCTIFDTQHPSRFIDNLPIGHPIANTQVYVLDPYGESVPMGSPGELYIGGAGIARGYLNRPDLTKERFRLNPFSALSGERLYKTGDLGRWLPDGTIEYLGRNDFQVKLRGFRIELGEIEAKLRQCQGVREAVVLARKEDDKHQKRLVAYLLAEENKTPEPTELRRQLAQQLTEYMLPSAFVILDDFPLTPNGKLNRAALPEPDQAAIVSRDYVAPEGDLEITLVQIWQKLLGLERVGRYDHFFELGGHSLIIVSLIEQLRSQGWDLDIHTVFSTPILTDMAEAIQAEQDNPAVFNIPPNLITDNCTTITPDMLPLVSLSQHEIDTIANTVTGGTANIQDIYPLAPLQEGILFHHILQQQGDIYLLRNLLTFDTRERLDAFLVALQQVIDRHDILRTSFYWQKLTQPVQIVWRKARLHINTFVPNSKSKQDIQSQLLAYTDPQQRCLDINKAPLFAADIVHEPHQDEWLLSLSFHHLINDNITVGVIITEIHKLLNKCSTANLPTPLPYRNFVVQSLCLPTSVHETYFRERLADVDTPTAPFGILDVHSGDKLVTAITQSLDTELNRSIRAIANRQGVSPSVLFHVAWAQVLAKTSGSDDVVFGTVLLGHMQGNTNTERGIGLFINTLPIRIQLAGNSIQEVLRETFHHLTMLLKHEQAPLSLAQRCSGITPPLPLFSSLLNYRHSKINVTLATWEGIRLMTIPERTNYPITLSIDDLTDEFRLHVLTVPDIDPTRLITYMITALKNLTEALETAPQRLIADIPILSAADRQQVLMGFNSTLRTYPQDTLIHQLVEEQAQRTPDATAVVFEDLSLSYNELNRQANQLAHYLIALGVHPEARVAICVERSLEMIIGLLAILKAGGAYVPLDPTYPTERLMYMLEDAAPIALLTQTMLIDPLSSTLPTVNLDNPNPAIATMPTKNPDARILGLTPNHLAYVIYTSGSTGQPKGVMVEHANIIRLFAATQARFQFNNDLFNNQDVWTLFHSFAFDFSVWELWGALAYGGRLIVITADCARSPQMFYSLLCREQVTILNQTPSAFRQLIAAQDALSSYLSHSLRCIIFGGEALELHTLAPWVARNPTHQTRLVNMYGITEITVHATYRELTESDIHSGRGSLIGQPLSDLRIYILDALGQPVPFGVAGELYITGAGVARGYLNRPELTAERFLADPFSPDSNTRMYKTGDLGRWLPDGNIEYLGRNDFQVKIRGFRIELGEIEARLEQCHGVREAVVLAHDDLSFESTAAQKRLVAYLLPQAGVELIPAELRQQLSRYLADYMLPSAFVTLESFPLTANGKLDRQAFPAPNQSAAVIHSDEAPIGDIEITLAQIWQELLRLEQVGRHDNFFVLGGHSLMIMQLIARIQAEFFVNIPMTTLFLTPTLSKQANVVFLAQINEIGENDLDSLNNMLDSLSPEEIAEMISRGTDQ